MLPNRLRGVQHCGTSSPPFRALRNANLPAPRQVQKHLGTPKIPLMPMHTDPNLWPGHWAYLPHSKRKSVISKCNGLGMGESEMELKKKKSKWDYSKGGLYFYYTGARRQCASSALIHNKSAKLLLSLETKIAVALKTHWKHLLSSLFFFPSFDFGTKMVQTTIQNICAVDGYKKWFLNSVNGRKLLLRFSVNTAEQQKSSSRTTTVMRAATQLLHRQRKHAKS